MAEVCNSVICTRHFDWTSLFKNIKSNTYHSVLITKLYQRKESSNLFIGFIPASLIRSQRDALERAKFLL